MRGALDIENNKKTIGVAALTGATAIASAFIYFRYRIARPSEYVVRTGLGIKTLSINKQALQWPFQTAMYVNLNPHNYLFHLQAMSKEKMEFILPGVFTIGPEDDMTSLHKYSTLLTDLEQKTEEEANLRNIDDIVKGIIEGETRVLAAAMDIEDIFNNRDGFKRDIIKKVQEELDQFGLKIYNANIKELEDAPGSEYFVHMRQRKRATAEHQARKDIADAQYQGDIGVKERERDTRIQSSQYETDAIRYENDRNVEMAQSTADYQIKQAEFDRMTKIAQIESNMAANIRQAEMQKDVENRNIAMETEKLRSTLFSKAVVEAEAKERAADATLYAAQKEAEGIFAILEAQASGLQKLMQTVDDPHTILQYMMIDKGMYEKLAAQNAEAIKGLQPKITHWVTGKSESNPISDLMKNIPPLQCSEI